MGFEPTTPGLKVRSSTAELRAPFAQILYLVFSVECQSEMPVSEPLPTNCRQNFRLRSPGHRVGTSGEETIHRFRRIPLDVGEDVAVRIERNCDRGVAEPFRHHLRVHSRLQHESRCRVPQIVETHTCQPYCGFQLSEATADRGAIQGSARGPGEDKVVAGAAEDGGAGADYGGAACHEGRGRAHLPRHDSPRHLSLGKTVFSRSIPKGSRTLRRHSLPDKLRSSRVSLTAPLSSRTIVFV